MDVETSEHRRRYLLALEASIARGPGVFVLCSQGLALSAALGAAIAHGASGIISFGIAGGLAPELASGDWVVASGVKHGEDVIATDRPWAQRLLERLPDAIHAEVVGADVLIPSALEKFQLYTETGAAAVDMEFGYYGNDRHRASHSVCCLPCHHRCGSQKASTRCHNGIASRRHNRCPRDIPLGLAKPELTSRSHAHGI